MAAIFIDVAMGRPVNSIFELVYYIRSMSTKDKQAFRQFIGKYRSNYVLDLMLSELEESDPKKPRGLLYRLISNQNSTEYKNYLRLKKQLFEFEITSKRIDFFKQDDVHQYLHNYLKKEIISAQILTHRNAYYNAIHSLNETFRKAEKFEMLDLQEPCAKYLTQFYKYTGNEKAYSSWKDVHQQLAEDQVVYEKGVDAFELEVHDLNCCIYHDESDLSNENDDSLFNEGHLKYRRYHWMRQFKSARKHYNQKEFRTSMHLCFWLMREYQIEPGLYPLHYNLLVLILTAENLWKLKRFNAIDKLSYYIGRLDVYSMHHRIPALYMALCYFLKAERFEHIGMMMFEIKKTMGYEHFGRFISQVNMIQIMVFYKKGEFQEFLKAFNRDAKIWRELCLIHKFILKSLEVMSFHYLDEDLAVLDKYHSLKKFVSRNIELQGLIYTALVLDHLKHKCVDRSYSYEAINQTIDQGSVTDLRWIVFEEFVDGPHQHTSEDVMISF